MWTTFTIRFASGATTFYPTKSMGILTPEPVGVVTAAPCNLSYDSFWNWASNFSETMDKVASSEFFIALNPPTTIISRAFCSSSALTIGAFEIVWKTASNSSTDNSSPTSMLLISSKTASIGTEPASWLVIFESLRHASLASLEAFYLVEQSHADGVVSLLSIFDSPVAHVRHWSYFAAVQVAQVPWHATHTLLPSSNHPSWQLSWQSLSFRRT